MSVFFHCFGEHLCHETYPLIQLMRGGLCDGKKVSDGCNKDLKKKKQEINVTFYVTNQNQA